VLLSYPAGDRLRRTIATAVENSEEREVSWSDYHEAFVVKDDDADADTTVVVLR